MMHTCDVAVGLKALLLLELLRRYSAHIALRWDLACFHDDGRLHLFSSKWANIQRSALER